MKEVQQAPMLEIMDRTMAGEHIFPDSPPAASIGMARDIDIIEQWYDESRKLFEVFRLFS